MRSVNWFLYSSLTVFGLAFVGNTALAGDHDHWMDCIHHHHGPLPPPAPPAPPVARTACDAGHPFWVGKHSMFTDERNHRGYYVGGGSAHGESGPCPHEGTFGWDYRGLSNVMLGFNHGRRYQGGGGTYQQETSKPIKTYLRSLHD